jgi:CRISPR-associated endonuclease Cas2
MNSEQLFIFCYDTPSDNRRRAIVRLLENVADRVQYSVFQGLMTEAERVDVWERMMAEINVSEDKLCYYKCCSVCRKSSGTSDGKEVGTEALYWLV